MNTQKSSFPIQKLPRSKKTEEWRQESLDAVIGREGSGFVGGTDRKGAMLTAYGLYNSEFSEDDLKYVTNPFKVEDGFPAKPQNMNIIRPKIDLLIGEESKRPFNVKVIQTNYDAVSKIQDEKKNLLMQYIQSYVGVQQDEQGQPITPPEIEKYMKYNYKTIAEETAFHSLNYLKEKLNLQNEFLKGWKDALISSEEIYYVGVINGEPSLERVNPVNCDYDKDPDLEYIEDGDWFLRRMEMSPATIYDRFFDLLDESDLDKLLSYTEGRPSFSGGADSVNNTSVMYREKFSNKMLGNSNYDADGNMITVYHGTWRSYARTGFLSITDPETGEVTETMVDESYKAGPGEEIKWEYVPEIWEGYRAGEDLYFGIGPVDYQHVSIDNPSNRKLPYCGTIYSNVNSRPKSLVTIMKPLQYMYIILWYRLELALARDKGKVLTMDITQIPKGLGISVEQWMHYVSALGVNFVNPYDEGWDIPGREGGRPAPYNQMTAMDLSMANAIAEYISLMMKIEDMIGEISGVSKQRQGAITSNELVGNVERAVIQSSHITEPLFWVHNQVKKNALTMLLDAAKSIWSEKETNKKLHYVMNDSVRIFMDITDDFLYADHDIFLTDATKEEQNIQSLRSMLQPAMSSGATLLEAAEIITGENMSQIKKRLMDIDKSKAEMIAAQQQAQQQASEMEMQMKHEEFRIKEEDSIRKSETALQVAIIQANASNSNSEEEVDEEGQTLEYQKLLLQSEKIREEIRLKDEQVKEAARANRKAEEQKDVELQIRRTVANKPKATSNPK